MHDATLLILAGGQSRRMGTPKARLDIHGRTLVEWIVERLGPVFAETLVSANEDAVVPARLRVVRDLHIGAGPLAGIEAGLAATAHAAVLAVACDMPLVTPDIADRLLAALGEHDAAVPTVGGRPEPACAVYATASAPAIAAALGRGERRVAAVLEELDVAWVDGLDPAAFRNLNTPEDYRSFLDALR